LGIAQRRTPFKIDDLGLLAPADDALVANPARVKDVGQEVVEAVLREELAARGFAVARGPRLHPPTSAFQFLDHGHARAVLQMKCLDLTDAPGFLLIDGEPAALRQKVVTERRKPADPFPFAAGGSHLVARALGDHLALELRTTEC
jgi:hypothetical protein